MDPACSPQAADAFARADSAHADVAPGKARRVFAFVFRFPWLLHGESDCRATFCDTRQVGFKWQVAIWGLIRKVLGPK